MSFPPKAFRWIIAALVVIVLVLAANESVKPHSVAKEPTPSSGLPYPYVPYDIDPRALDSANPIVVPTPVVKKPVVVVPKPEISAEAYIVANLETGELYSQFNSGKVFPIASLSKLITAIVALKNMQPGQKITITEPMLEAYGDAGHLVLGETYPVSELLYPLLLESSNDAAEAFAQSYGYAEFLQKMNAFTAGIGMSSTSFRDSSGLSSGNVSNAKDLLVLARYLYTNEKPLLELTRQTTFSVASTTEHGSHTWNTINPFPFDPHFIGGKTGRTTEAKESMISLFRYTHGIMTYPVAIIVLRSDFSVREIDSAVLFEKFIQKVAGI